MSEIVPNFLTGGTALFAVPLVDAAFAGGGPRWMLNCEFSPAAYGSSWILLSEERWKLATEQLTENNVMKYKPKNAMSAEKNSCNEAERGRSSDWAGLMPGPPRVRPGVLYSGLLAGANLIAASTALVRARGSAPRIVLMGLPPRKIMNVGMLKS